MPPQKQTPEQILSKRFSNDDLDDVVRLYGEGLDIQDDEEQREHLGAIAELLGDFAVFEALSQKVEHDRRITQENVENFKSKRAQEAADNIIQHGFAVQAPDFAEQLNEDGRNNTFTFGHYRMQSRYYADYAHTRTTEKEGLVELDGFLRRFLRDTKRPDGSYVDQDLAEQASSILENLTFIGEKEYDVAVRGIAAYWKDYLDQDPRRQICALAAISDSEKYPDMRKSDSYMRDRILRTFTDEELEKYSGRIVSEIIDVVAHTQNALIILLDDWAISGSQMRDAYNTLIKDERFRKYAKAHRVEVNLIVASQNRLQEGLKIKDGRDVKTALPVKSYYRSHSAPAAKYEHQSHVSGVHSAVNYDFKHPINRGMVKLLRQLQIMRRGDPFVALANIIRPYRSEIPQIQISANRLRRTRPVK